MEENGEVGSGIEFKNGLFSCFDDIGLCIITYFVPCLTAGQNAEAVGESCILYGVLSVLSCIGCWSRAKIRGMVREQKGIEGSFGNDMLMACFCPWCALVQEARELRGDVPGEESMARA